MLVWVELQLCRVHVAKKGTFIVHLIRMVGMVHALNTMTFWSKEVAAFSQKTNKN